MNLPEPEALAASEKLQKRIASKIREEGGWIPFSVYMGEALYAPKYGYYTGGTAKLGAGGDFVTAPEIGPLFGEILADALKPLLGQTEPEILELGAGTGRLAGGILESLKAAGVRLSAYSILELSPELQSRQKAALAKHPEVRWLPSLPAAFSGIVVANEVLDAVPADLVVRRGGAWREAGVAYKNGAFVWAENNARETVLDATAFQIPDASRLPEGYMTEVHPQAVSLVRSISEMLKRGKAGAALFIDYGFPSHEYYHPDRASGTLICHCRHRAHTDPFFMPGLQDITVHADFTAAAKAAEVCGLEILCYATQAGFLLEAGFHRLMAAAETGGADPAAALRRAHEVNMLTSPAEMGELFKVLVLGHKMKAPAFLQKADRSGRL